MFKIDTPSFSNKDTVCTALGDNNLLTICDDDNESSAITWQGSLVFSSPFRRWRLRSELLSIYSFGVVSFLRVILAVFNILFQSLTLVDLWSFRPIFTLEKVYDQSFVQWLVASRLDVSLSWSLTGCQGGPLADLFCPDWSQLRVLCKFLSSD